MDPRTQGPGFVTNTPNQKKDGNMVTFVSLCFGSKFGDYMVWVPRFMSTNCGALRTYPSTKIVFLPHRSLQGLDKPPAQSLDPTSALIERLACRYSSENIQFRAHANEEHRRFARCWYFIESEGIRLVGGWHLRGPTKGPDEMQLQPKCPSVPE